MTCFANHAPAVSISNQNLSWHSSFSRKPRWRTCAGVVVFEESYDREGVVHTWQPYRPAVKVKTWKRNGKGQLAVTSSLNSGYGRPKVVCHISSGCVHTSITSKSDSKIWVTSPSGVPSYVMVGIAEVSLLKKKPDFCLVSVHLKPFKTCILVMEFVQLEL
jgi:hypothetical protein